MFLLAAEIRLSLKSSRRFRTGISRHRLSRSNQAVRSDQYEQGLPFPL